jgi:hypothetical protein
VCVGRQAYPLLFILFPRSLVLYQYLLVSKCCKPRDTVIHDRCCSQSSMLPGLSRVYIGPYISDKYPAPPRHTY